MSPLYTRRGSPPFLVQLTFRLQRRAAQRTVRCNRLLGSRLPSSGRIDNVCDNRLGIAGYGLHFSGFVLASALIFNAERIKDLLIAFCTLTEVLRWILLLRGNTRLSENHPVDNASGIELLSVPAFWSAT